MDTIDHKARSPTEHDLDADPLVSREVCVDDVPIWELATDIDYWADTVNDIERAGAECQPYRHACQLDSVLTSDIYDVSYKLGAP